MVNWNDPVLVLHDYIAFVKLNHVIAGLYIWETVFTAGFELDVLRRKRPYRWTIWLYLGTRYTLLLAFICLLIDMDSSNLIVPCEPFSITILALIYVSWASASFTIVLRVIAIWGRNIIVSLIAIGVLSCAFALNIWHLTLTTATYDHLQVMNTCTFLQTHKALVNCIAVLVADVVLLLTMLIGLLRHAHRCSTGIWKMLYQQCVIWFGLALVAEIPLTVLLILNLNDVWNGMFLQATIAILSIGAARMYRSLSDCGSFTEYVSLDPPQFSSKVPIPAGLCRGINVSGPTQFASVTQLEGTRKTYETPVFLSTDSIHVEFVPGISIPDLAHVNTKEKVNPAGYNSV